MSTVEFRLNTIRELQLTQTELKSMITASDLEDNINGFYVRYEGKNGSSPGIALLEGIRMGAAYTIDEKSVSKYLVISQPPQPKAICRITEISDSQFTTEELEVWEASLAILQRSATHRIDVNEARRRKDSLTYSDGNTEIISRSRSGTTVEVKPHVAGSSAPRSPLLRNSIKLFEQKAQENAKPATRNTAIKKKAASARFYPVVSEKPPEAVKSSSDENESPRKPSKASRSSSDEPNSDSKIQPKEEPKLESPKKVQEESLKPVQISKEPESPKKPEKEPDVQVTSSDKPETVKGESKQPEPVTTPEPEVNDSKEPEEIKEEKENDGGSNNNKEVSLDDVDEEKEEKDNIDSPKESSSKSKEDEEEKEDAVKMKEEEKEEEGDTPNVSPKTEEESKPEETDDKEVDDNEDDKGDKKDKEKDKIISSGSDKESDIPSSPT